MKSGTLYISYDGLLDPLGGSQILPYIYSISRHQGPIHILSFEKRDRYAIGAHALREDLLNKGIGWSALSFTASMGKVGKLWDLARLYLWATYLVIVKRSLVTHTRGHPCAMVGYFLKRIFNTKLIFDFRGLWVDERVDKGGWNLEILTHRMQYQYFKMLERKILPNSDHVVVLTNAVVNEVMYIGNLPRDRITVIPCCADFDHFPLVNSQRRAYARDAAAIPKDALVLGYLGSVGRMYLLDRFFRLFELAGDDNPQVMAFLITQDVSALEEIITKCVKPELHARIHICTGNRVEMPRLIAAMDILVSFIKPSYARIAASPTKLAECFAAGIPAICNAGVGDVESIVEELDAGYIADPNSEYEMRGVVEQLDEIRAKGGIRLRHQANTLLGLHVAAERYQSVYQKIGATSC
jgi:glycosyltransferase involved in cell wall biosynthesis